VAWHPPADAALVAAWVSEEGGRDCFLTPCGIDATGSGPDAGGRQLHVVIRQGFSPALWVEWLPARSSRFLLDTLAHLPRSQGLCDMTAMR